MTEHLSCMGKERNKTIFRVCEPGLAETLHLPSECLPRLAGLKSAVGQVTSCVVLVLML